MSCNRELEVFELSDFGLSACFLSAYFPFSRQSCFFCQFSNWDSVHFCFCLTIFFRSVKTILANSKYFVSFDGQNLTIILLFKKKQMR